MKIKSIRSIFLSDSGLTLAEMLIAAMIIAVLASAILPVARMTVKRTKEIELQRALRIIRTSIDKYKELCDGGKIETKTTENSYPPDLETLVEGVPSKENPQVIYKFLRRIPENPFNNSREWGMRSYQDDPESTVWGGENVYDVYSLYNSTALDGSEYKDW